MANIFEVNSSGIVIGLGIQTESGIRTIKFHIEDWITEYGSGGTFYLWNKRSNDSSGYPVTITSDSEYVYWTPTYTDLAYSGFGELQLDYTFGTAGSSNYKKVCTQIFTTHVIESMETSSTVPSAYTAWVTQVENYATRAEAAAEEAEETAATLHGIPSGGTAKQVITKKSATDYDIEWANSAELPPVTSADNGKILKVQNGSWALCDFYTLNPTELTYNSTTKELTIPVPDWSVIENG